jgi:hypothetical protein
MSQNKLGMNRRIPKRTHDAQAMCAQGFRLPAVDKKTDIPPSFMQAAAKISPYRAGSNHQYSHNLLSLFVAGSQMK